MPQLGKFAVPIGTFVEQIENFLFTFMDHENKHDFHFVVQMKKKIIEKRQSRVEESVKMYQTSIPSM